MFKHFTCLHLGAWFLGAQSILALVIPWTMYRVYWETLVLWKTTQMEKSAISTFACFACRVLMENRCICPKAQSIHSFSFKPAGWGCPGSKSVLCSIKQQESWQRDCLELHFFTPPPAPPPLNLSYCLWEMLPVTSAIIPMSAVQARNTWGRLSSSDTSWARSDR